MGFKNENLENVEAKDLMIGDWVLIDTYPEKVKLIGETLIKVWNRDDSIDVDDVLPIPLTAEILEKNGFKVRNRYIWEQRDDSCCVKVSIAPNIEIDGEILDEHPPVLLEADDVLFSFNVIVEYVHDLQFAMRLCGVEKEIIL